MQQRMDPHSGYTGKLGKNDVNLPGVKTRRIRYEKRDRETYNKLRRDFASKHRKDFLKAIASDPEKAKQLEKAGLSKAEIDAMRVSGIKPDAYQVHHKLPLDDGGTNDFSNLVLIKNDPYHKVLTNSQTSFSNKMKPGEIQEVDFPVPDGFVYPP